MYLIVRQRSSFPRTCAPQAPRCLFNFLEKQGMNYLIIYLKPLNPCHFTALPPVLILVWSTSLPCSIVIHFPAIFPCYFLLAMVMLPSLSPFLLPIPSPRYVSWSCNFVWHKLYRQRCDIQALLGRLVLPGAPKPDLLEKTSHSLDPKS